MKNKINIFLAMFIIFFGYHSLCIAAWKNCPAIGEGTGYCNQWSGFSAFKETNTSGIQVGKKSDGSADDYCGFFKFDLSQIPSGVTITKVQLSVSPIKRSSSTTPAPKIRALASDPSSATGSTIWSETNSGTDLYFGNTWSNLFSSLNTTNQIILDSDAKTLVTNNLSKGWCAIGLLDNQLNLPLYGTLAGTAASSGKPVLSVTYTGGPADLEVTPTTDLTSSGQVGGSFSPSSEIYTLKNNGAIAMNWTAAKTKSWVNLSKVSGLLNESSSETVTVSINSNANSLGAGSYSDTITFTNKSVSPNQVFTRNVYLTVNSQTGSLQATILPQGAIDAGAKWQVDGGTERSSGNTQSGLSVGNHTVSFKSITGWDAPANVPVTINSNKTTTTNGIYTQQVGSLKVTIGPTGAVIAGATWNVDGGTGQASDATVNNLAVGTTHTVNFNAVTGWTAPKSESVTISKNNTKLISRDYVKKNEYAPTYLGALAEMANSRGVFPWLNTEQYSLSEQYQDGIKNLAYFSAQLVMGIGIYIDLDDYYSAIHSESAITTEGSEGWVTVWIDGSVGGSFDITPAGMGILQIKIQKEMPDPKRTWDLTALSSKIPFIQTTSLSWGPEGFDWGQIQIAPNTELSASIVNLNFNVFRFEIQKELLDVIVDTAITQNMLSGSIANNFGTKSAAERFINAFIEYQDGWKITPKATVRYFTSSDDDSAEYDGVICHVRGGYDLDDDGIPDNVFPVVPTFYGVPFVGAKFNVTFQNTGLNQTNYYLRVRDDLPQGWLIGAVDNDGGFAPILDRKIDVANVNPVGMSGSFVTTEWMVAVSDSAPDSINVTFDLYNDRILSDELLESVEVKFQKYKTAAKATTPSPSNNAVGVVVDCPHSSDLRWSNGGGAVYYNVYFGTNPTLKEEDRKLSKTTATVHGPDMLDYYTTYYWRVDSISSSGAITTGDVWKFTTEINYVVEIMRLRYGNGAQSSYGWVTLLAYPPKGKTLASAYLTLPNSTKIGGSISDLDADEPAFMDEEDVFGKYPVLLTDIEKKFPVGNYTLTVKCTDGKSYSQKITRLANPYPAWPAVTSPADNAVITSFPFSIAWTGADICWVDIEDPDTWDTIMPAVTAPSSPISVKSNNLFKNGEKYLIVVDRHDFCTGSTFQNGSATLIRFTLNTSSKSATVPNVKNKTTAVADAAIIKAGLKVGKVTTDYSNTIAAGSVISTDPIAGKVVAAGSKVNYIKSLGKPVVPNVKGKTPTAANTAITAVGLKPVNGGNENSSTVAAGLVSSQAQVAGTKVAVGSTVTYKVSLGKSATVPNVVDLTTAKADAAIIKAGLKVGIVTPAYHNTIAAGNVIISDPIAGKVVAVGSKVNYLKSRGFNPAGAWAGTWSGGGSSNSLTLNLKSDLTLTGTFKEPLADYGLSGGTVTMPFTGTYTFDSKTNAITINGNGSTKVQGYPVKISIKATGQMTAYNKANGNYSTTTQVYEDGQWDADNSKGTWKLTK